MPITPGTSGETDVRRTPRPLGADEDALRGLTGNLIGAGDDVRGVEPGEGALLERGVLLRTAAPASEERTPADRASAERAGAESSPLHHGDAA